MLSWTLRYSKPIAFGKIRHVRHRFMVSRPALLYWRCSLLFSYFVYPKASNVFEFQGEVQVYLSSCSSESSRFFKSLVNHGFYLTPGDYCFNICSPNTYFRSTSRSVIALIRYSNMYQSAEQSKLHSWEKFGSKNVWSILSQLAPIKCPHELPFPVSFTPHLIFFNSFLFPALLKMPDTTKKKDLSLQQVTVLASLSRLLCSVFSLAGARTEKSHIELLSDLRLKFHLVDDILGEFFTGVKTELP